MRPKLVLGWGVVGVVAVASSAAGQFASDRGTPPPGTNAPGSPPTAPPSLGQITPAAPPAPTAPAPAAHPWYVKPENGAWMICVKSYTRATPDTDPKAMAEALAKEIRETYKVPAYLFEKGSDEKKRQEEFIAQERARQQAEMQKFFELNQKLREESIGKGIDFIEAAPKLRIPKYLAIEEQWAVLIGGWKDMETASKELKKVRAWQPPKNEGLMDRTVITRPGPGGQRVGEAAVINPFQFAMVFPNPVAPKTGEDDAAARAVLLRLNEKEELSVLRIGKPWTLAVKSFHPPVKVRDKDGEKSVVEKLFSRNDGEKDMQAVAMQAVAFAKALRDPKFKPHPMDAYVMHTLYGSIVCVGQFESGSDPTLFETARKLEQITFHVQREDQLGAKSNVRLFDPMFGMPVPRLK